MKMWANPEIQELAFSDTEHNPVQDDIVDEYLHDVDEQVPDKPTGWS